MLKVVRKLHLFKIYIALMNLTFKKRIHKNNCLNNKYFQIYLTKHFPPSNERNFFLIFFYLTILNKIIYK